MWCLWGLKFDVPYLEEAGASGRFPLLRYYEVKIGAFLTNFPLPALLILNLFGLGGERVMGR